MASIEVLPAGELGDSAPNVLHRSRTGSNTSAARRDRTQAPRRIIRQGLLLGDGAGMRRVGREVEPVHELPG